MGGVFQIQHHWSLASLCKKKLWFKCQDPWKRNGWTSQMLRGGSCGQWVMMWAPRGLKDGGVGCMSTFKLLCFISLSSVLALIKCAHRTQILARVRAWPVDSMWFGTGKGPPTLQWKLLAFSGVSVPFGQTPGATSPVFSTVVHGLAPLPSFVQISSLPLRSLSLWCGNRESLSTRRVSTSQTHWSITDPQPSHPL